MALSLDHSFCAAAHCFFVHDSTFVTVEGCDGAEVDVEGAGLGVGVDCGAWAKTTPVAIIPARATADKVPICFIDASSSYLTLELMPQE